MISLQIQADSATEFKNIIMDLYSLHFQPAGQKEVFVQKLPPDPRLHGSNVLTTTDRLRYHIEETTNVGGCFSITSACLVLGFKTSQIQNALQSMKKAGAISMVKKGIWKRII